MAQWLGREFTDRRVRGSDPTSASRSPLSRFGQPDSIPALVHTSGCMVFKTRLLRACLHCLHWGEIAQWLERERTDRKVRGSNPASASRLPLPRLGQPGSIPALVLPSGGMAARHRKGATAERFFTLPEAMSQ
ncbi:hypothetical protein CSKR_110549 [Clonorchis sinensis]|uniref:Uncharacterized protein n=1 Tax=Clonorchis sinensis TaxID=79923 RepID=A0A3R7H5I4_CLOSI|nr:hypothetical protein CSKR_110549 [Clonorchis sinensis]